MKRCALVPHVRAFTPWLFVATSTKSVSDCIGTIRCSPRSSSGYVAAAVGMECTHVYIAQTRAIASQMAKCGSWREHWRGTTFTRIWMCQYVQGRRKARGDAWLDNSTCGTNARMQWNRFGEVGARELARALANNASIMHLDVSVCSKRCGRAGEGVRRGHCSRVLMFTFSEMLLATREHGILLEHWSITRVLRI